MSRYSASRDVLYPVPPGPEDDAEPDGAHAGADADESAAADD